ncbi:MAG: ABC transporter substrate-binding protein [Burkholderiales bacterium]
MAVTLIENFRAVFYTPFYAAFALKAYEAEGVDVRMETSSDASKTLSTLMSGAGQVSWGGPMRLMHALDDNPGSGVVSFCEIVGRDPFYLVGRTSNPGFRMADLLDKTLAVVSEVPTPWYCLQHDLRLAGVDPMAVKRAPAAGMAENLERLHKGEVDVIQVFEPLAHNAAAQGFGHVWYSAASRGPASYTTFNTTRAFLERDPETALRMTRAMFRTQKWIAAHDGCALAAAVAEYFPDLPQAVLATCLERYKAGGIWNTNPLQQRAGVEWLRDAMLACGAIKTRFAFEDLSDMRWAEQVMREDPPSI